MSVCNNTQDRGKMSRDSCISTHSPLLEPAQRLCQAMTLPSIAATTPSLPNILHKLRTNPLPLSVLQTHGTHPTIKTTVKISISILSPSNTQIFVATITSFRSNMRPEELPKSECPRKVIYSAYRDCRKPRDHCVDMWYEVEVSAAP